MERNTLLIVDDAEINRAILCEAFRGTYNTLEAENGRQALDILFAHPGQIAAVLLDVVMPVMDGLSVLEEMSRRDMLPRTPVFLITTESSSETVSRAYQLGVVDVIPKPFNPSFILRRVGNILELYRHRLYLQDMVQQQTAQLQEQAEALRRNTFAIIETLSTAIEFRDCESGEHIKRIRDLTSLLLREIAQEYPEYGLTDETVELISEAAVMHDVGKIAIPDHILNKPGRLTDEEFEIMKTHPLRGCEVLDSVEALRRSEIYRYAYDICRHHHERYDGNGYPDHLAGDDITIWAQVVSLADVYDALVSERVYKRAYSHEKAMQMIHGGECGQFNPALLRIFDRVAGRVPQMLYCR